MWLVDPASAELKPADPKQAEIDQLKGELADRDKTIAELQGKIKKAQDALK
jgi:peptidoglycan hydrolase CwlO-like protein